MRLSLLVFTFIIANAMHSADLAATYKIDYISFLEEFLHRTVEDCDKYYRNYFDHYLNVDVKTRGSFAKMVQHLFTFKPEDFKTKVLHDTSRNSIINAVMNMLEKHKLQLCDDLQAANESFREIIRDYFIIEMLQKSKTKPESIDISALTEAVTKIASKDRNAFKNIPSGSETIVKHLQIITENESGSISRRIGSWLEFKAMPNASIEHLLTQLIKQIKANPQKAEEIKAVEAITTIIELLRTLVYIHSGELTDKYQFVYKFGEMIIDGATQKDLAKSFLGKLMDKVMQLFAEANKASSWKLGKKLLVKFFLPEFFKKPTPEYRKFLLKKYTLEGMKRDLITTGYPFMLKCYHLDLLNTFTNSEKENEKEIFEPEDLKFLFSKFSMLADKYSQIHIELFDNLRELFFKPTDDLFLKSTDDLDTFYSLFNSLYDTVLHAVQTYNYDTFSRYEYKNTPEIIFNNYLDQSLRHLSSLKSYLFTNQPDPKYFASDIKNRYFFYKFINLIRNLKSFGKYGIRFLKFDYSNDVLIHKYTLKPESKAFIDFLRSAAIKETFNYKVFSEKEISPDVIKGYLEQQLILEDMDTKIVFQ